MGHAILERARMFGAQSADYITASGHSGRIVTEASLQAKTGRIHDRTRTLRSSVRFLLHRGHRPYMTLSGLSGTPTFAVQSGALLVPFMQLGLPLRRTWHERSTQSCLRGRPQFQR
jgi:hypothetical protein